jgi:hypothetical protein
VATIEAAGCGDRARSAADEQARADLRRAMQAGEPVDEIFESFIGPLVEKAVPDAGGYVPLAQREEALQVTIPGAHRPVRSGTRPACGTGATRCATTEHAGMPTTEIH